MGIRYLPPHLRHQQQFPSFPQERRVQRTKVLVVPFIEDPDTLEKHIIFFLDTDSKEWTLVTGGCSKRDQNGQACADRELREESNKALSFSSRVIDLDATTTFSFETDHRVAAHLVQDKQQNIKVTSTYHVFLTPVKVPFETIAKKYYESTQQNSETSGITLFPLETLKKASPQMLKSMRIWDFVVDECLPRLRRFF